MRPEVLFLLVAYKNRQEVERFIGEVSGQSRGSAAFSVCDNSPVAVPWQLGAAAPVHLTSRPDNPGYLEGGLLALENYIASEQTVPSWVVLSNSDLGLDSKEMRAVLGERSDFGVPLILAPRITEIRSFVERNPHLDCPRSPRRLVVNRALTWCTPMAYAYLIASSIRSLSHWKRVAATPPPGQRMYAPYGAMIVFSRGFLQQVRLPRHVPLFAEEFAIAEVARRADVPVVFEPRIHAYHRGNATTGPSVSWRRAELLRRAFRYMYRYSRRRFDDG